MVTHTNFQRTLGSLLTATLVVGSLGCDAMSRDSEERAVHDKTADAKQSYKRDAHPSMAAAPTPMQANPQSGEAYDRIVENAFATVADAPLSTFSVDVDTAAYSNMRRFLKDGRLPPADAVRIEELVNYFDYDYEQPIGAHPFSVTTEVGDCPWADGHKLVHVGLQGKSIDTSEMPPRNLVFLLDVSGSMNGPRRLPLLKQALKLLVGQLSDSDKVSIVVYAGASGVVLEPTPGSDRVRIVEAMDRLRAGGSTNGGEGIKLAYDLARRGFIKGGINRVMLATDGDFNVGVTSEGELTRLIEKERESGVFLSIFGFGTGNLNDSTMEKLADKGNGNYGYIDSLAEARKLLVQQAGATLATIAKDVKIQVEFNPARVASYRLIGYENRILANEDFNDDSKDAGDIGAGHTVTALYEVVPTGAEVVDAKVDPLKYQSGRAPTDASATLELAHVKLRYKAPEATSSALIDHAVRGSDTELDATSNAYRFSAAVAQFGMLLRASKHKGTASFASVKTLATGALGTDRHQHRREFLELVERATRLSDDPRPG